VPAASIVGSSPNRPSQACGQIRCGETHGFRQHERKCAAGQCNAKRPGIPAGTDIGADQRDQRCAQTEHQRHQQIFEPSAGAVSGDRAGTGRGADQRRRQQHRQSRLECRDRSDRSDAQDICEQRPA